ncbi:hypothetical protein [Paraburkholderia phosphatilytica]|uniref:hypothetical protein n=1 Tax=Paraburkholderia phosphatilytica TaxID=2282883 RepID=UPI000E503C7C|nr:hypothetical protein [Paraburkholderia phosphatilytica]
MNEPIRSEREEYFEQLCIAVDGDEAHEQEAIECFENALAEADIDPAHWLDIALFYSLDVARGIVDMVPQEDRARSAIADVIADNLDIAHDDDDCQHFMEAIHFALANGVAVDLDVLRDGCERALDDLDSWASDDAKAPLLQLRDEIDRLRDPE